MLTSGRLDKTSCCRKRSVGVVWGRSFQHAYVVLANWENAMIFGWLTFFDPYFKGNHSNSDLRKHAFSGVCCSICAS